MLESQRGSETVVLVKFRELSDLLTLDNLMFVLSVPQIWLAAIVTSDTSP